MEDMNREENISEESASVNEKEFAFKNVINGNKSTRLYSIISTVLSALSVLLCLFPWVSFVFGALGILFAIFSRKNLGYFDNISLVGLIVGIFGTVFSVMGLIFVYALEEKNLYDSILSFFESSRKTNINNL